jgi:hypothetical protein
MRKKLTSRRGETLLEALIAVLIVALSAALLATMVSAGAKIGRDADKAVDEYYKEYNAAESGAGIPSSVRIDYSGSTRVIDVTYLGETEDNSLRSYRKVTT